MKNLILFLLILSAICLFSDIEFARGLYDDELFEEAISEFEKVISSSPTSREAEESTFYIAECYRLLEDYNKAEIYYRRLWDGYPDNAFKDRALYYLGFTRFQTGRYKLAARDFSALIEDFPRAEITSQALVLLLQSYYRLGDYNQVIVSGRKLIKNYEKSRQVPDIMLLMSKAYFATNISEEGNKLLKKLVDEYPDHNVRWQALELEVDMIAQDQGEEAAASFLAGKLEENLPRIFEENLRLKLLKIYLRREDYSAALTQAMVLTEKFNNSERIGLYLTLKAECLLNLGRYQLLITDGEKFKKEIEVSDSKDLHEFYTASALFQLRENQKSRAKLDSLIETTDNDSLVAQAKILSSRIDLEEGRFLLAIEGLKSVVGNPYTKRSEIYFAIANILQYKLEDYRAAIKFYEQIQISSDAPELKNGAYYQAAICYEQIEDPRAALKEIENIDLTTINDDGFKAEIFNKEKYLREFRIIEHERALKRLLDDLYDFLSTSDETRMKQEIVSVYTDELKDFETGLSLLSGASDESSLYQKARIYLKLIDKKRLEGKTAAVDSLVSSFESILKDLEKTGAIEKVQELTFHRNILLTRDQTGADWEQLEFFVMEHPQNLSTNYFLFQLVGYYLQNGKQERAADLAEKLVPDDSIDLRDYHRKNLALAEYFYNRNNDVRARDFYQRSSSQIDLNSPQYLFHYAVTLDQTGKRIEAIGKLEFLVNNAARDFTGFGNAVKYYSDVMRTEGNMGKTISILLLMPEKDRDDDYYLQLATDYRQIGLLEEAKQSLLHVVEKDSRALEELAWLQYETADLEMALYTYSQLATQNSNIAWYQEMSGRIKYLLEMYQEAASDFEKTYKTLGTNKKDYKDFELFCEQFIISLYKIGNRPSAESVTKNVENFLKPGSLQLISLHEANYYKDIDPKKAEKLLIKLLKEDLTDQLKYKVHFWLGVTRLSMDKLEEAVEDFHIALYSDEAGIRNNAILKLGSIAFTGEKFQEALDYYYRVISEDETGEFALDAARNFAVVCKTIEEWQKAVMAYEIILDRWGDSDFQGETVFDIAYCHFRDHKYRQAIEMFQRSIPMLTEREMQAEAQFWTAEAYFAEGEYDRAVAEFLKIGYNYADFPQWAASGELRAAESYLQSGKIDRAVIIYERVIEKYGSYSQWGEEASSRLEQLKN